MVNLCHITQKFHDCLRKVLAYVHVDLHVNVDQSVIHNSEKTGNFPNVQATSEWMNKGGASIQQKTMQGRKETYYWNTVQEGRTSKPLYRKKPDTKAYISYDSIYLKSLEKTNV